MIEKTLIFLENKLKFLRCVKDWYLSQVQESHGFAESKQRDNSSSVHKFSHSASAVLIETIQTALSPVRLY